MTTEETPLKLGKKSQICVPSDRQIVELVDEMTSRVSMRRKFLGQTVSKQTFLNCIILGLAHEGPETWDYLFDLGASILGPAIQAGEPGTSPLAGRPLKKRFKWFS